MFRGLTHDTEHKVVQSELSASACGLVMNHALSPVIYSIGECCSTILNNLQLENDYRSPLLILTNLPWKISPGPYGGIFYKSHLTSVTHLSAHFLSVDRLQIPSVSRLGRYLTDFDMLVTRLWKTKVTVSCNLLILDKAVEL